MREIEIEREKMEELVDVSVNVFIFNHIFQTIAANIGFTFLPQDGARYGSRYGLFNAIQAFYIPFTE